MRNPHVEILSFVKLTSVLALKRLSSLAASTTTSIQKRDITLDFLPPHFRVFSLFLAPKASFVSVTVQGSFESIFLVNEKRASEHLPVHSWKWQVFGNNAKVSQISLRYSGKSWKSRSLQLSNKILCPTFDLGYSVLVSDQRGCYSLCVPLYHHFCKQEHGQFTYIFHGKPTYQIFHEIWKLFGYDGKFVKRSPDVVRSVILFPHDRGFAEPIQSLAEVHFGIDVICKQKRSSRLREYSQILRDTERSRFGP